MALRAFSARFLVAIDEEEARENEQRGEDTEVTVTEIREYLKKALRVDFDCETHGNPCGVQSIEVLLDGLTELQDTERKRLYKR